MNNLALETRNLAKRYGRLQAVDRLDLRVPAGCIYGFLGPNGAGKSTTIRMLLGLIRPTGGEAFLLGRPARPDHPSVRREVGALVEGPAFVDYLSARRNLEMLWALSGGVRAPARQGRSPDRAVDQALELVGLTARQREIAEVLVSSGRSLERILDDLLDLSKVEAGRLELEHQPFDLAAELHVLGEIFRAKAEDKGVAYGEDVTDIAGRRFVGDPLRIKQIVSNLLSNAVKFTHAGSVSLRAKIGGAPDAAGRHPVILEVRDTGIGVEPEAVDAAWPQVPERLAEGLDPALVGLEQARQGRDQGRLARAGRAHDHGHVAVQGVEVHALEHLDVAAPGLEALDEAGGAEGRGTGGEGVHRRRSAGWLFLRTPRAMRPEAMEIAISRTATRTTQPAGKPMGMPALVARR